MGRIPRGQSGQELLQVGLVHAHGVVVGWVRSDDGLHSRGSHSSSHHRRRVSVSGSVSGGVRVWLRMSGLQHRRLLLVEMRQVLLLLLLLLL